jgi:hypothetical protein
MPLRWSRSSSAKETSLPGRSARTPSSVVILRVVAGVMTFAAVLSLFGFIIGKQTINKADDPVDVIENRLLRGTGIPLIEPDSGQTDDEMFLDGPLGNLLPEPDVLVDPRDHNKRNLYPVDADPGFPPDGTKLGTFVAKLYLEHQRRYENITLELVQRRDAVYLAGAGMCEVVQSRYVLLKPCIFREEIVSALSSGVRGPYEMEILRSLSFFVSLPFEGYSRHITSTFGCGGLAEYRMTVQYLRKMREGYISLRIPYSVSEVDAVDDLIAGAATPCRGEDVFFEPEQLMKMLALIDIQRAAPEQGE